MFKIKRFIGKNEKVAYAIDTKKYRFWFSDWCVERFPKKFITNVFTFEIPELSKLYQDSETKIFSFKYFWKGFQPVLSPKKIQMLINRIELLEEDIQCINQYLDNLGIPQEENNQKLSIVGRIKKIKNETY